MKPSTPTAQVASIRDGSFARAQAGLQALVVSWSSQSATHTVIAGTTNSVLVHEILEIGGVL